MEHPGTTSTIIAAYQAGKDNPKWKIAWTSPLSPIWMSIKQNEIVTSDPLIA